MCSSGIAKCILVIFNTIFFLLGVAVLAVGIFVIVDKDAITGIFDNIPSAGQTVEAAINATSILKQSAYILIAAGGFVFIIGFLGCFGALCKNNCLLYIYAIFVFLILALQIAAGVVVYFYKDLVDTELSSFLTTTVTDYYEGSVGFVNNEPALTSSEPVTLAWDAAMAGLSCCGSAGSSDFASLASKWNNTYSINTQTIKAVVPPTCCIMEDPTKFPNDIAGITFTNLQGCLTSAVASATHQNDCFTSLKDLLTQYLTYVMGAGIGIGLIEIVVIVGACVLIRANNKDD